MSMRALRAFAWTLCLALAQAVSANTTADENWGSVITGEKFPGGKMKVTYAGLLCSNLAAADTNTCTAFDFASTNGRGIGDAIVLHLFNDGQGLTCTSGSCVAQTGGTNSCATASATFRTAPILGTGQAAPASARAIAVTSVVTDDSDTSRVITLNTRDTPLSRYLFTEFSGAGCDDVDITIEIYEPSLW